MIDRYNNFYKERSASRERKSENKENTTNPNVKKPVPQKMRNVKESEQLESNHSMNSNSN